MTSSLVGSEMCIRDRASTTSTIDANVLDFFNGFPPPRSAPRQRAPKKGLCLLYTSDAADDM
eukprot:5195911-Prorocentrum_lima.AAC.1